MLTALGRFVLSVFWNFFAVPTFFIIILVIILATYGFSFGIRRFYVNCLLKVFEWGRQRIELYDRVHHHEESDQIYDDVFNDEAVSSQLSNHIANQRSVSEMSQGFQLSDAFFFCRNGIQNIVEDQVTQRFDAAELRSWNLLTRTNDQHEFISVRLTILWFCGFLLRYFILLPFRLLLLTFAITLLVLGMTVIGSLPEGSFKKWAYRRLSLTAYRIAARAWSAVITFHNRENRAQGGGICVANHTSPIDIAVLGCDNCYAMVGQEQGGLFGTCQRALLRAERHVWFNRAEAKDRSAVTRRLREHVENKKNLPILIFPEGTCINNTSIMMFKKGSFEVGGTIYPVAIKYDPRFADPFWNSSKYNLSSHLLMVLTSWALVCDVWYLPPMTQEPDEDAIHFASRVKSEIARQGGLVDLEWDGQLKRSKPKASMREKQQEEYSRRLKGE